MIGGETPLTTDTSDEEVEPAEAERTTTADDLLSDEADKEESASVSGTAWEYSQYYVEYSGLSASTKNRYELDVIGNATKTKQTIKYQFQFHNSETYGVGDVKIYLPYALYNDRLGNPVLPAGVGVSEAPTIDFNSDFNYTVESVDGEMMLCFTNCKEMKAGTDNFVQILYRLDDMYTIDGTEWEIKPKIVVMGQEADEEKLGTPLEGSMDTEARLTLTKKEAYHINGKAYLPGLYTPEQIENWTGVELTKEQMEGYLYVLWRTTIETSASQPWTLHIEDEPSDGGQVVGQFLTKYNDATDINSRPNLSSAQDAQLNFPADGSCQISCGEKYYLYTVTAYPSNGSEYQEVENTVNVTLTGWDDKIENTLSSTAKWTWQAYTFTWPGGRNYFYKSYAASNHYYSIGSQTEESWLDVYRVASEQGSDLALPEPWYVGCGNYHAKEVADDENYTYRYALIDDLQFAASNETNYRQMSYKDYYYQDIRFIASEFKYDISDPYDPVEIKAESGEPYVIYVMTAEAPDVWQLVDEVPFTSISSYEIPQNYYADGIYEIKVEHASKAATSNLHFTAKTVIRSDSPLMQSFLASDGGVQVQLLNLAGCVGIDEDGSYTHWSDTASGSWPTITDVDLDSYELEHYGCTRTRDYDYLTLTSLMDENGALKGVKMQNDPKNGRVGLTYTLTGWDGYLLYNKDAIQSLRAQGVTPMNHRDEVVMYDLLPLGVIFDASVPVTAGSLTTRYSSRKGTISSPGSWNTGGVTVQYEVTDNYRNSGRQMVKFTISYAGGDNTVCEKDLYENAYRWFTGYGVEFGAYYMWSDYDLANAGVNVMSYVTPTAIRGSGYTDDGTGVPISVGEDDAGQNYFFDPEGDGLSAEPDRIYAQVANNEDFAIAAQARIQKTVKADADVYGIPGTSASVALGNTYTYTLRVTNSSENLHDLIIYDHLENAVTDRTGNEATVFDENYWQGTFAAVDLNDAKASGIAPVVYYSANRDQEMNLSADGWVKADEWGQDLSEVRSIAFDLSKKTDGSEFILEPMKTVDVGIRMKAPDEMQTPAVYAYNNPAFYSYYTEVDTGTPTEPALVVGDSVRVKLHDGTSFAVEKTAADGISNADRTYFSFLVTIDGGLWANKEYTLLENGEPDGKAHSTDQNGILRLKAGQRAVFSNVPDGAAYTVNELQSSNHWTAEDGEKRTGFLQKGTEAVAAYTNHYSPLLYVEKRLQYAQDYTPNDDTFTFQLALNGAPAANREYALVDRAADYDRDPAVLQCGLYTDANGCFTLTAAQRAMFWVDAGTNYTLTEVNAHPDYTCSNPTTNGAVKDGDDIAFITNDYKYKDLYVYKKMLTADGVDAPEEAAYTFTLTVNGTPAANQEYELYQRTTDPDTGAEITAKVADNTTDENGRFTLTPSQYARIKRLPAGAAFTVAEDTSSLPQNVKPYGEAAVSDTMPQYAPSKTVELQNEYLLRALQVSKTVISGEDDDAADDLQFTFAIKVNNAAYANQKYLLLDTDGDSVDDEEHTTDASGRFTLKNGQRAVFQQLHAGDAYEVQEQQDDKYVQVVPVNNAAAAGTIPADFTKAEAEFINAPAGGTLWVTKSVTSKFEGLAEDSLWTRKYDHWDSSKGEPVYTYTFGGMDYRFYVEVNGQPYANQAYKLVSSDGTVEDETTSADGHFDMNATQKALFLGLQSGDTYKVYEGPTKPDWDYGNNGWHEGQSDTYWRQIIPENGGDASGKINDSPQMAAFTNEYILANHFYVRKMVNSNWASDANEDYDGTAVLKLKLTLRDSEGNLYTGPDTLLSCDKDDFTIDENGIITITVTSLSDLNSMNLYIPFGYDFKLEEVGAEPEEIMGKLSAIGIEDGGNREGNYAPTVDEDDFVITNKTYVHGTSESVEYQIDIFNTNAKEKFQVYKQAEGGKPDQTFTFTLYKSDVLRYNLGDVFNYEAEASYKFVTMPNEPYDVYDTASGALVDQRRTDANGQFTLQGGQYAEFTGYRHRIADSPDSFWIYNPDANDTIYKIVETPYANYVPQVTIVHSTSQRGEWHEGYTGEDGNWVKGYYDYITSETTKTAQSNSGAMQAGDHMTFVNTYGNSSSLVVTKTVQTRGNVQAPAEDEFTFCLNVEDEPYAEKTYTRFGSDGAEITNVVTETDAAGNEYSVEKPWTTDRYGQFTLKAGERAVFDWVGEGKSYTVTERPKSGYTQISPAAGTGISGVLTDTGAVADFENFYNKTPGSEGATLTIRKQIALPYGVKAAPDEAFTFRVKLDGKIYTQKAYAVYGADGALIAENQLTDENGTLTLKGGQYAVFSKLPVNVDYEVEELLADGSSYTALGNTKCVGATQKDGVTASFTNAFGNLLVSKQVRNVASQTAPAEDTFQFTLTLDGKAAAGQPYWILNAKKEKTGEAATDAEGSFTLHSDEFALFYGLELGSSYQVTEAGKTYYTQTVPVSRDGYSGEIGTTASSLLFVNDYSKLSALEISKQVVDENGAAADSEESFTFKVTVGGKVYANKPYVIYGTDGYKKAGVYTTAENGTITLLSGERAVLTGVLPGAKYTVEEIGIPNGYMPKQSSFSGKVDQNGTSADFVNVKKPESKTGKLIVSKKVAGTAANTTEKFTFTVTLNDSSINGTYGKMNFKNGVAVFQLGHGETCMAEGLPAEIQYQVTEAEANQNGYTTTVIGGTGTIIADKTVTAAFINAKDSETPPTPDKPTTPDKPETPTEPPYVPPFVPSVPFEPTVPTVPEQSVTPTTPSTSETTATSGVPESVVSPVVPAASETTDNPTKLLDKTPKTEDEMNLGLWFALLAISLLGMAGSFFWMEVNRHSKKHNK